VESNEPTTPSRTAAPGTFAPEAASTHEHKCSSRCAFVSLLRSPTTNAETIQEAPSSRYENYSMTPSRVRNSARRRRRRVRHRRLTRTRREARQSRLRAERSDHPRRLGLPRRRHRQRALLEVVKQLFAKEKRLKKPFLLVVEECHEYIPEGGGMDETGKMLIKVGKRGRKHGLGIVGIRISQRPADVKRTSSPSATGSAGTGSPGTTTRRSWDASSARSTRAPSRIWATARPS